MAVTREQSRETTLSRRSLLKAAHAAGAMAVFRNLFPFAAYADSRGDGGASPLIAAGGYPDWIAEARIHGLSVTGLKVHPVVMQLELDRALEQGASVIEADSRLSDYLSDEEFEVELRLIKDSVKEVHARGLKVVWYIPSLEVITPNGRLREDTIARLHPDWLQLSFDGRRRGVFYGQKEFWIGVDDESAWVCPNSPFRAWFLDRLRRMAATGVDGIWLDVPLFGLIVAEWGCTCPYCREKFALQTGMEFPERFDVGDARFWRFIQWRHETLTEFIEDCKKSIQAGNRETITIAEVVALDHLGAVEWGTEGSTMRNNFVVWEVDGVSETTAMADASYDDWMSQYNIYKYCRGATADRPSWAFCYGYDESDAQLVMAGAVAAQNNPYELRVPKMTTTVGRDFRGLMYNWIRRHTKQIYRSESVAPVAVLYSERNRDFLDATREGGMVISEASPRRDRQWLGSKKGSPANLEYIGDYRGLSILLFQQQIPADVHPISRLDPILLQRYKVLVLPYMASLSQEEKELLLGAVREGATLVVSGTHPGEWDEAGRKRSASLWADVRGSEKGHRVTRSVGKGRVCFFRDRVGRKYLKTHARKVTEPLLEWCKDVGVEPWVEQNGPVVVQPYAYGEQMIIHVLNYGWVGKMGNRPKPMKVQLSVPWSASRPVRGVTQSEPQWQADRALTHTVAAGRLVIPLEVGIHSLVVIDA